MTDAELFVREVLRVHAPILFVEVPWRFRHSVPPVVDGVTVVFLKNPKAYLLARDRVRFVTRTNRMTGARPVPGVTSEACIECVYCPGEATKRLLAAQDVAPALNHRHATAAP